MSQPVLHHSNSSSSISSLASTMSDASTVSRSSSTSSVSSVSSTASKSSRFSFFGSKAPTKTTQALPSPLAPRSTSVATPTIATPTIATPKPAVRTYIPKHAASSYLASTGGSMPTKAEIMNIRNAQNSRKRYSPPPSIIEGMGSSWAMSSRMNRVGSTRAYRNSFEELPVLEEMPSEC